MKPSKTVIEFFYDVVSPYSWIAFEILCRYKTRWDIDLKWKPFFLGAIMKETGNNPPAMVPQKGSYMINDLMRNREFTKVSVSIPKNFAEVMTGTLPVQRFITAVDLKFPQHTEELSRKFWTRIFQTHEDVLKTDSMKEVAKQIGLKDSDIEDTMIRMKEQLTKDRLKSVTAEALKYGAFGAPTIVAHINNKPEMFFGSDRFELLAYKMGKQWHGPNPDSKL